MENVVGSTKTRFYRKRISVTMCNYVEKFHANIGHNLALKLLTKYLFHRKRKLWPPSSKRYNSKTQRPQTHILIFFLISSTLSICCTIANLVVWISQKIYNIIIWHISTLRVKFAKDYCRIITRAIRAKTHFKL